MKRDEPERNGPIRNKPIATQLLERGVETAYMVVEEYMLRGRQAAGRRHAGSNGHTSHTGQERPNMSNDRQDSGYGNGYANTAGPIPAMMMPLMQMMRMWTDGMSQIVPGGSMATEWMNQFMPGAASWAGTPSTTRAISVHISSRSPAEVTVDLDPGAEYAKLSVDPLVVTGDNEAPHLAAIRFECETGHIRVRVTVPNDQPPGSYFGHIHDATGARRGELRVVIDDTRATVANSTSQRKRPAHKRPRPRPKTK